MVESNLIINKRGLLNKKNKELNGKQTVLVIIEFCPCQFNWKQYSHNKQERSVDYFNRREGKKCDLCRWLM